MPALLTFAAGFVVLGFLPTLSATFVGVALIGIGVGRTNPPLLALLGDVSPKSDVGKMGGVYDVFGDVGSTLGPPVAFPVGATTGTDGSIWPVPGWCSSCSSAASTS